MYRERDAQHYLQAFSLPSHQGVEPMEIRGKIVRISSLCNPRPPRRTGATPLPHQGLKTTVSALVFANLLAIHSD